MSERLPRLARESLDEEQGALYDAIVGGPRGAGPQLFQLIGADTALEGPFNAMLFSPALGTELQRLGAAVRYRTTFADRAREIAILCVAAAWRSGFEAYAHEAIGRSVGLSTSELADIAAGRIPATLDATEAVIAEAALALSASGELDGDLYARAHGVLGDSGLFELTTLVGYYATLALQLRVFSVDTPGSS